MRILLVDEDSERTALLKVALEAAGYGRIAVVPADADLPASVRAHQPDVLLVDLDAPGRDILDAMSQITRDNPRPIVMFVDRTDDDMTAAAIRAGVSAYIVQGLNRQSVRPIVSFAIAKFKELQALREDLDRSKADLAARKVIEKAKGILMARKSISEEDAYRALRSMAMTQGKRLSEVAENLIAVSKMI